MLFGISVWGIHNGSQCKPSIVGVVMNLLSYCHISLELKQVPRQRE